MKISLNFSWFKKLTDSLSGRTTAFLFLFFIMGNLLQIFHRLDATYIAFFVAFMSAVIGHSIKEDLATPMPLPEDDKEKTSP